MARFKYAAVVFVSIAVLTIGVLGRNLSAQERVSLQGISIGEFASARKQITGMAQTGDWSPYQRGLEYCYLVRKGYVRLCEMKFSGDFPHAGAAAKLFESACKILPDEPVAHCLAGEAYLHQGRPAKAVRHLERVPKGCPDYGRAQLLLAMAYRSMATTRVTSTINGVTTKNTDTDTFLVEKGQSATDSNRKKWRSKAYEAIKIAKRTMSDDPYIHYVEGAVHWSSREIKPDDGKAIRKSMTAFAAYLVVVKVNYLNVRRVAYAIRLLDKYKPGTVTAEIRAEVARHQMLINVVKQKQHLSTGDQSHPEGGVASVFLDIPKSVGRFEALKIGPEGKVDVICSGDDHKSAWKFVGGRNVGAFLRGGTTFKIPTEPKRMRLLGRCRYARRRPTSLQQATPEVEAALRKKIVGALKRKGWNFWPQCVRTHLKPLGLIVMDFQFTIKGRVKPQIVPLLMLIKKAPGDVPSVCDRLEISKNGDKYNLTYVLRIMFRAKEQASVIQKIY